MLKLSITIRKDGDKLEPLYVGEDAGKALDTYRNSDGEVYLYQKAIHNRSKKTKPMPAKKSAKKAYN